MPTCADFQNPRQRQASRVFYFEEVGVHVGPKSLAEKQKPRCV